MAFHHYILSQSIRRSTKNGQLQATSRRAQINPRGKTTVTSLILGMRTLLNAINIKGIDNFIFSYFSYDLKVKYVRTIKNIVDETVPLIIKMI